MKNPLVILAVSLLRLYQMTLSHVFAFFGVKCRHYPTCSAYGIEAFRLHGVWTGFWLTLSRLLRCHPFGSHGIDPVPPAGKRGHFWEIWKLGDWSWASRGVEGSSRGNSYAPTNKECDGCHD